MLDKPESTGEPSEEVSVDAFVSGFLALAERCGADEFHLFRIRGRKHLLVPILDGARPDTAPNRLFHPDSLPEDFTSRVASLMCCFWWEESDGELGKSLGDNQWAERIHLNPTRGAGLALPIAAGDAGQGVAIFSGTRLQPDHEALMEIHASCHALFTELPETMPEREVSALPAMSRREMQCLKLTAHGLTSDDIAGELGLSVHTANQYLANAAQKLNATNRIHAVAKAMREGLID